MTQIPADVLETSGSWSSSPPASSGRQSPRDDGLDLAPGGLLGPSIPVPGLKMQRRGSDDSLADSIVRSARSGRSDSMASLPGLRRVLTTTKGSEAGTPRSSASSPLARMKAVGGLLSVGSPRRTKERPRLSFVNHRGSEVDVLSLAKEQEREDLQRRQSPQSSPKGDSSPPPLQQPQPDVVVEPVTNDAVDEVLAEEVESEPGLPPQRGATRIFSRNDEQLKAVFELFDTDGSGSLDVTEVHGLFSRLGLPWGPDRTRDLMSAADVDGNCTLDFNELVDIMNTPVMQEAIAEAGGVDEGLDRLGANDWLLAQRFGVPVEKNDDKTDHVHQRINRLLEQSIRAILPDSRLRRKWDLFLLTYIGCICVYRSVQIVSHATGNAEVWPLMWVTAVECLLTTVVYGADVLVTLKTAVKTTNGLLVERADITVHYLSTAAVYDVAAAVPLDLVFLLLLGGDTSRVYFIASGLRLLKLLKVPHLFQLSEHATMDPAYVNFFFHLVPLIVFVFWILLSIHSLVLLYVIVHSSSSTPDSSAISYGEAFYWVWIVITALALPSNVDPRQSATELQAFVAVLFLVGVILQGIIVGRFTVLVLKSNVQETQKERMRTTLSIMKHYNVPDALTAEVLGFQFHSLQQNVAASFAQYLDRLPTQMQHQISIYIKIDIISQVPMFKQTSLETRTAVASALKQAYTEPDVYICTAGEVGHEMYFLMHGFADVVIHTPAEDDPDDDVELVVSTLKRGDFFGEVALLSDHATRTASIKALTYCDLFVLEKDPFDQLMELFEDLNSAIHDEKTKREEASKSKAQRQLAELKSKVLGRHKAATSAALAALGRESDYVSAEKRQSILPDVIRTPLKRPSDDNPFGVSISEPSTSSGSDEPLREAVTDPENGVVSPVARSQRKMFQKPPPLLIGGDGPAGIRSPGAKPVIPPALVSRRRQSDSPTRRRSSGPALRRAASMRKGSGDKGVQFVVNSNPFSARGPRPPAAAILRRRRLSGGDDEDLALAEQWQQLEEQMRAAEEELQKIDPTAQVNAVTSPLGPARRGSFGAAARASVIGGRQIVPPRRLRQNVSTTDLLGGRPMGMMVPPRNASVISSGSREDKSPLLKQSSSVASITTSGRRPSRMNSRVRPGVGRLSDTTDRSSERKRSAGGESPQQRGLSPAQPPLPGLVTSGDVVIGSGKRQLRSEAVLTASGDEMQGSPSGRQAPSPPLSLPDAEQKPPPAATRPAVPPNPPPQELAESSPVAAAPARRRPKPTLHTPPQETPPVAAEASPPSETASDGGGGALRLPQAAGGLKRARSRSRTLTKQGVSRWNPQASQDMSTIGELTKDKAQEKPLPRRPSTAAAAGTPPHAADHPSPAPAAPAPAVPPEQLQALVRAAVAAEVGPALQQALPQMISKEVGDALTAFRAGIDASNAALEERIVGRIDSSRLQTRFQLLDVQKQITLTENRLLAAEKALLRSFMDGLAELHIHPPDSTQAQPRQPMAGGPMGGGGGLGLGALLS
eukprot:TRINITY_DN9619_c0_g2_i1.p1 TRINITY_DN9619_c0_g2~~TRINITY_DN9619_c0_g2_i1.p1  ORF type:complete len:1504 (+),score=567.63 TRINITY_DN9619_c0_g2_i1:109-4620(+)